MRGTSNVIINIHYRLLLFTFLSFKTDLTKVVNRTVLYDACNLANGILEGKSAQKILQKREILH